MIICQIVFVMNDGLTIGYTNITISLLCSYKDVYRVQDEYKVLKMDTVFVCVYDLVLLIE